MMEKVKALVVAVITTLLISGCSSPVVEEKLGSCSAEQGVTVKDHISKQINAIADGDWQRAYDYAAPSFKQAITLTEFKQVISKQYLFLIFNNGINFGECKNTDQGINQIVYIDFQGKKRTLSYDLTLTDKRLGVVAANEIEQKVEVAA
jgi:outer membrane murein-binding lipoprotein Lpp